MCIFQGWVKLRQFLGRALRIGQTLGGQRAAAISSNEPKNTNLFVQVKYPY